MLFGEPQRRLDDGQEIVGPVIDLVDKQLLARLDRLLAGDIDQHVDRADDDAGVVAKHGRMGREAHPTAIGPFGQASTPRTSRPSLRATAMGHSS